MASPVNHYGGTRPHPISLSTIRPQGLLTRLPCVTMYSHQVEWETHGVPPPPQYTRIFLWLQYGLG
jgi:hypothetical protein